MSVNYGISTGCLVSSEEQLTELFCILTKSIETTCSGTLGIDDLTPIRRQADPPGPDNLTHLFDSTGIAGARRS